MRARSLLGPVIRLIACKPFFFLVCCFFLLSGMHKTWVGIKKVIFLGGEGGMVQKEAQTKKNNSHFRKIMILHDNESS